MKLFLQKIQDSNLHGEIISLLSENEMREQRKKLKLLEKAFITLCEKLTNKNDFNAMKDLLSDTEIDILEAIVKKTKKKPDELP